MICESCFRKYKAVHELEEIQCYDATKKEYFPVFECPICNWVMPDYSKK